MSDLYVLQGRHDCGKTETLNYVIQILSNKYTNSQINTIIDGVDKKVIFKNIKSFTIGIETQGDPNSRLEKSLTDFLNAKCNIIFCACRTTGMTVTWVNALSKQYTIHFIPQTIVSNNHKNSNLSKANSLISLAGL
jgi:hypothetical protein